MTDRAPARASSRLRPLEVPGPAGILEALLQEHAGGGPPRLAVVCHPHPLHGGTLHNKVVHRVAAVLHERGATVLRFNFRGVGGSSGRFDAGAGESDDARAAIAWLRARHPGTPLTLAGFSFGAWIAARVAGTDPGLERLVLIAPPVATSDFAVLGTVTTPKLVVQGTGDTVCPPEALEREMPGWAGPKRLEKVAGASHFFDRQLGALAQALREGLDGLEAGATSSDA